MERTRPLVGALALAACALAATKEPRPYRLRATDIKQRVIWGAECRGPDGTALAFGGQDQDAPDGRPHTRILEGGAWKDIHEELRARNPLQKFHSRAWSLRCQAKDILAAVRRLYFEGLPAAEEAARLKADITPCLAELCAAIDDFVAGLPDNPGGEYERGQVAFARRHLEAARRLVPSLEGRVAPDHIKRLRQAQIHLALAAEAFDAEPPPRALDCGPPLRRSPNVTPQPIVYETKTGVFVLFGGDHLDYLTNDTWVFDLRQRRWFQRHPPGAPPPRANHRLEATGDGKVRLAGGYTYASNTDYCGGQYLDLDDGTWTYDVEKNIWSGGELVPPDSRLYRTGPFDPDFYLRGERPDAARFQAWLRDLPLNAWVPTNPPQRPRLNRDWGTARLDPSRDIILRWSGGHSAHGGTDVLHYHLATNRWELPFPVEFPLGQLYTNTSYPRGFNFNLRPWVTGHTYQSYDLDPPSGKMIFAGRRRHYYVYDPDRADWVSRGPKPPAMRYNGCFYDLTLVATPTGVVCWDRNGRVHRFDHRSGRWVELKLSGRKLPGACVDNSTAVYDSRRNRILLVRKRYGQKHRFDGQVYALDLESLTVRALSPEGMDQAHRIAWIDRGCYDAANDLFLLATYLKDAGGHTPTPAYDCARNRWVVLDIAYRVGERYGRTVRAFPNGHSCGMVYDPKRKLIWGTDTNGQVYVLRLDPSRANIRPLANATGR